MPAYPSLVPVFAAARDRFSDLLDAMEDYGDSLLSFGVVPPPAPRWDQDWFPRLDGAAAYTMVRRLAPARIVEVGTGHSTRFLARALADGQMACRLTAIDPAPRADVAGLPIDLVQTTVQATKLNPVATFEPGDILSIDSSHVLMPGTDVDMLYTEWVPALPPGAYLHVHDIMLPDAYPEAWAWRGYNEQSAVALLLLSGGWRLVWSSHAVLTAWPERLATSVVARLPLVEGAFETSVWLERLARLPST